MRSLMVVSALQYLGAAEMVPHPTVYEIAIRPWLYSLAQSGVAASCGDYVCLKDVPISEWQRIADDHVDVVWLNGMWQLGEYALDIDRSDASMADFRNDLPDLQKEDVIGSAFSITQYAVNSDIGTNDDLAKVRKTLHGLGMKLMLDFVPNHFAVDSVEFDSNPDVFLERPQSSSSPADWWFQRGEKTFAYGRGPYDNWHDVMQVNYWAQAGIDAMKQHVLFVASQADAVRCDMAHLMLNEVWQNAWGSDMQSGGFTRPAEEFWQQAIDGVRAEFPDTLFMAEAYNYYITSPAEKDLLHNLGFDFVYDKTILDKLKDQNLDEFRNYVGSTSQDFFNYGAHFVENHDEDRAANALHGQQQAFAGAVAASTIPGLRLFYHGQFEGFTHRLGNHVRRAVAEQPNPALHAQYTKLLSVLSAPVFHSGTWSYISVPKDGTGWRLAAWRWSSQDGSSKRLVVVNLSDAEGWGNVQVADAIGANGSDNISIAELLSGSQYTRSASEMRSSGLVCGVAPHSAQIFEYNGPVVMV